MTRLARRNRTRRIKLWKRRGYKYWRGSFWEVIGWRLMASLGMQLSEWHDAPITCEVTSL